MASFKEIGFLSLPMAGREHPTGLNALFNGEAMSVYGALSVKSRELTASKPHAKDYKPCSYLDACVGQSFLTATFDVSSEDKAAKFYQFAAAAGVVRNQATVGTKLLLRNFDA